jgi:hypothetical protein
VIGGLWCATFDDLEAAAALERGASDLAKLKGVES